MQWAKDRWRRFSAEHELGWEFRVVLVAAVVLVVGIVLEFFVVNTITELMLFIGAAPLFIATLGKILSNLRMPRPDKDDPGDGVPQARSGRGEPNRQPATKPTRRWSA
jgi:hypothetical protein